MEELIAEMHWFDIALLQEYYKCNKNAYPSETLQYILMYNLFSNYFFYKMSFVKRLYNSTKKLLIEYIKVALKGKKINNY